ncbi:activating signal cointegrator 1 complex subunit 3 [Ceratobasidium sp. AG-Ba]|nr:activating signal cointegrator 1 complex subunit 3 [Ceratobasidium sp. AG-Ba]
MPYPYTRPQSPMLPRNNKPSRYPPVKEKRDRQTTLNDNGVNSAPQTIEHVEPEPASQASEQVRLGQKPFDAPRAGFDDYGAELSPDARIWPTYVDEAKAWDEEMVDGWNRSLDVMLISSYPVEVFAALFSAVSTAFVIESFRTLQPDPTLTSVNALLEITQLLRTIANTTSAASTAIGPDPDNFTPSSLAIWINALWFLSLALSISVSLIAMLAKQWCYSYMSNRHGQPYIQARNRQKRLEELQRWKMPEILAFLPSLIHLSLFLFFIGLILNLWDVHVGVTIPVLATTAITLLFYLLTTRLQHAITRRLAQTIKSVLSPNDWFPRVRRNEQEARAEGSPAVDQAKKFESQAISWLIANSQDTRSVDIALQAIAGADKNLPTEPLLDCGAHVILTQRFRSLFGSDPQTGYSFLHDPNSADVASLYGRALEFFMKDNKNKDIVDQALMEGPGREFEIRRAYQCLEHSLVRSRPSLAAFGISGLSTLWSMDAYNGQLPPGLLKEAILMLDGHVSSESTLNTVALVALIDTISVEAHVWMKTLRPRERVRYPLVLLQILNRRDQILMVQIRASVAACLASFGMVDLRSPVAVLPQVVSRRAQSSLGQEFLKYYETKNSRILDTEALLVYGLISLFRNRNAYELTSPEIATIAQQLSSVYRVSPPLPSLKFRFDRPSLDITAMAIRYLVQILCSDAQPPLTADAVAEALRALIPYSFMWGSTSNVIYMGIAKIFTMSQSKPSKIAWNDWLKSKWTPYYAGDMLDRINYCRTFQHIITLLAKNELDRPAVPYAISHTLFLADQILTFEKERPADVKGPRRQALLSSIASQFEHNSTDAHRARKMLIPDWVRIWAEIWILHLENLKDIVPRHILDSGVLDRMVNMKLQGVSSRAKKLLEYCTARAHR